MSEKNVEEVNMKKDNRVFNVGFVASGIVVIAALGDLAVQLKAGEGIFGSTLMIVGGVLMFYAFLDSKRRYMKKHNQV
ncbi:MAG: hypothetical protein IJ326_13065 [Lachnospiraceae bacterium]|nr:hypothetical protein [Lachnospiraceae bacterium]